MAAKVPPRVLPPCISSMVDAYLWLESVSIFGATMVDIAYHGEVSVGYILRRVGMIAAQKIADDTKISRFISFVKGALRHAEEVLSIWLTVDELTRPFVFFG